MAHFYKLIIVVIFIGGFNIQLVYGQASTANYVFTFATNGSLTDMSAGTTQIIGPNSSTAGTHSTLQNIGFNFYFMGIKYTQFGVSSTGFLKLGGVSSGSASTNNLTSTTHIPIIAPFWDGIGTSSTGNVKYKVIGSEPNRVLILEWSNMRMTSASTTPNGTFQLRLYETTGKIEFVYGEMNIGAGTITASIGFSNSNANNRLLSITSISSPAVTTLTASVVNNLVNSNLVGFIPGLNSTSDGNRVIYTFTPPAANTPASLTYSNITSGSMTLNWSSAANAANYEIYSSIDGINYNYLTTVTSPSTSYNAVGLASSSIYYWRVYSLSEGIYNTVPVEGAQSTIAGTFSGLKTIGEKGNYTSIQEAFDAINVQGLGGLVTLELQADYNPIFDPPSINCYGNTSGSSLSAPVIVRPAAGVTGIVFTASQTNFSFNGTKYLIIDGRPGGTGTAQEITISNTNTSGSAVKFIDDASNNTIKYCKIIGVNTIAAGGVIWQSTSIGITGNDNNTIDNCEITAGASAPNNMIYNAGTVGKNNDNFIVSNCKIFNFARAGFESSAIGTGNNYLFTGNSFYQSAPPASVTSSSTIKGISLLGGGDNHLISGNYFGGQDVNCGGNAFLNTSADVQLTPISVVSSNNGPSVIRDNIIQNINMTGTGFADFYGIRINGSSADITGNTIGHSSVSNSISYAGIDYIRGILVSPTTSLSVNCSNNTVANITASNVGATLHGLDFSGNFSSLTDTLFVLNNSINNLSSKSIVRAIVEGGNFENTVISTNSIYSIKSLSQTSNEVTGIYSISPSTVITKNRLYDLSNTSAGNLYGIFAINLDTFSDFIIANNQVSILNNLNSNDLSIFAIRLSGRSGKIYYNSIYVAGSITLGSKTSSCIFKDTNVTSLDVRNNILYNERTGGTGNHYALDYTNNNTSITSDYNLLIGAASTIAKWGTTAYNFADYKTTSGKDGNSYSDQSGNVPSSHLFTDVSMGNLNIQSGNSEAFYCDGKGIPIASISSDYSGTNAVRNTSVTQGTTDVGSDEFDYSGTIPNLIESGPPALNTTTTYLFGGRQIGSIAWGNTGTVPTGLTIAYNPGVNPPGTLTGQYSKGYWEITATGGAGYTYDITFNYTPSILYNIITEDSLKLAKRDGGAWDYLTNSTVNTANKTVTATGLTSFSQFALTSSEAKLPVELASFSSLAIRNEVVLDWSTVSETNNKGFEVMRSKDKNDWTTLTFINGTGTSNSQNSYQYKDRNLQTGKYYYRLKQIDFNGNYEYFNLSNEVEVGVPNKYNMSQNYPNPFNPTTKINYELPKDGFVSLKIYDMTGRQISEAVNQNQQAGYYTINFNASNLSSGIYFYSIKANDFVSTKRMVLIK